MTTQQSTPNGTCIVIGNGPSLRGFDFHRLKGFDTLGMNAAYRHWDRVGWYPTFYACLDDQLIRTHHAEIERLFADGLVKKVFVHDSFFEHHPHRQGHPDFTSLYQTSEHWYRQVAEAKGLPRLYDRPAFKLSNPSKITTGAHAVRYVANMGYARIALIGIDLRYTEILPEAEKTSEIGLVMRSTPKTNPNYFFDGYQKAGDLFNIPNPTAHNGRLHVDSFELIAKDFERNSVGCQVINCNQESVLSDRDIFPYVSVNEVLGESLLGCVFVPTNASEIEAILGNLKLWSMAEFAPAINGNDLDKPALVYVFNNWTARPYQNRIRETYEEFGMGRYFSSLVFEYLDLEGEADAYIRDYTRPVGDMGFKAGPNNLFFESIRRVAKHGRYGFLMETDCLAIRRGWLTKLQRLVDGSESFWVMGSPYRGLEKLTRDYVRHLNGNAIYAVGDSEFQSFVSDFWEHHTWRLVSTKDKRLAYDCILEIMFSDTNIRNDAVMNLWKRIAHKFRYTSFIQNISGNRDIAEANEHLVETIRLNSHDTYVLHNRAVHKIALRKFAAIAQESSSFGSADPTYPRLLVFDMAAMANSSATGELKRTLLADWPADRLLQMAQQGSHGLAGVSRDWNDHTVRGFDAMGARKTIADFAPDVILYRPVPDTGALHALAMEEIRSRKLPLVTWIMDDWPARMEAIDPVGWIRMKHDLEYLLRASTLRLSICGAMSEAFVRRYGQPFVPFANGVDPADWPIVPKLSATDGIFRLRFGGGLAPDMNRRSILRIAEAVERLAMSGEQVRLEINTQKWWIEQTRDLFARFQHTDVHLAEFGPSQYREWVSQADAVAIAYNFDAESRRYVQYSMGNKMPECLASGGVTFAHGPRGVATIDYLDSSGVAVVVTEDLDGAVETALRGLIKDPSRVEGLVRDARHVAFEMHNVHLIRKRFFREVSRACKMPFADPQPKTESADLLDRLVRAMLEPIGNAEKTASLLLRCCASALLLAPEATLSRLAEEELLVRALGAAQKALPEAAPIRQHFAQVMDRVREERRGTAS